MKIILEKNVGGVPVRSSGTGKPIEPLKKKEENIAGRERSEKNENNLS